MATIKNKPAGHLLVSVDKSKTRYFERLPDGRRKYIRDNERDKAVRLAQNDYNEKLLKLCKYQLNVIQTFLKKFDPGCFESYYENLHPARRALVKPLYTPQDEYIKKWLSRPYPSNNPHPLPVTNKTDLGEYVRSKSEAFIANKLAAKGIPYLYEYPVKVGGYTYFPDFTVLHPVTKKVMIWEHLGQMDNPDYLRKTLKKLNNYQKHGYHQGINLIITMESLSDQLDLATVDHIINTFWSF